MTSLTHSKGQPIVIGKTFSMNSTVLKEKRPYWVYTPGSYAGDNSERRYAVLFLLDGDAHKLKANQETRGKI